MIKSFLRISTMFSDKYERNIRTLSEIYQDGEKLKNEISSLTQCIFDQSTICGKRILIKPNWVKQDSYPWDHICLRTHDNFILAIIELLLPLKPSYLLIGDAPIQGCDWGKMILPEFEGKINGLSKKYGVPVELKDFRRTTFDPLKNNPVHKIKPITDYVIFNLGNMSYLEPISVDSKSFFRITNYDPRRLAESHRPGIHKYCLTEELFNADIIITLPKVKTHEKTGLTAALKNIVGLNGDKDFLPHHRLGGTGFGGDCYPGKNYLRYFSELALDRANMVQGKRSFNYWTKLSSLLWKISFPGSEHQMAAGWYGNDTVWRMVLDLNNIAIFGKNDGTLASDPQRILISLCDGIIGGQGDGPLKPEPLPLGIISFTNNSLVNDIAMALLMGFDFKKFPLLVGAEKLISLNECEVFLNGLQTNIYDLNRISIHTQPPKGWERYLQKQ